MSMKPVSRILMNRTKTPSASPKVDALQYGELSLNYADGKLFYKDASGNLQHFKKKTQGQLIDYVSLYKSIVNPNEVITAAGRTLYRHSSGMGTVIEFNDGQDRKVLVLDAKYRTKARMSSNNVNTNLPDYMANKNTNDNYYLDGVGYINTEEGRVITDSVLNSLWWKDTNTSKHNTDVWLTQADCDAATHCRGIMVNNMGCDIPNIQTLMRIYCEGFNLDALDPTVEEYSNYSLRNWCHEQVWSSSELDAYSIWNIGYTGYCGNFYYTKDVKYGVCPVLEL